MTEIPSDTYGSNIMESITVSKLYDKNTGLAPISYDDLNPDYAHSVSIPMKKGIIILRLPAPPNIKLGYFDLSKEGKLRHHLVKFTMESDNTSETEICLEFLMRLDKKTRQSETETYNQLCRFLSDTKAGKDSIFSGDGGFYHLIYQHQITSLVVSVKCGMLQEIQDTITTIQLEGSRVKELLDILDLAVKRGVREGFYNIYK